jgi:hypothetical protein
MGEFRAGRAMAIVYIVAISVIAVSILALAYFTFFVH